MIYWFACRSGDTRDCLVRVTDKTQGVCEVVSIIGSGHQQTLWPWVEKTGENSYRRWMENEKYICWSLVSNQNIKTAIIYEQLMVFLCFYFCVFKSGFSVGAVNLCACPETHPFPPRRTHHAGLWSAIKKAAEALLSARLYCLLPMTKPLRASHPSFENYRVLL